MAQAMQSAAMAGLTSTSNDMKDRISSLFEELEAGFKKKEEIKKEPETASGYLKRLTNKMAEGKKMILEYERLARSEGKQTPESLESKKKEYVAALNKYVKLKKELQAQMEAEKKAEGPSTSAASSATQKISAFALPFAKKKEILEDEQLQKMEGGILIQHGREIMDETDKSVARSQAVVEETIQIGTQTAEALRGQTQQMERIVNDLDEIQFSLKKSFAVLKDITKGLATDKCIMFLLFLVVVGVLVAIILKSSGY